jgi:hypothetical protein
VTAKTRLYSFAAALWAGFYLGSYTLAVHRNDNGVAWWYVGLVAAGLILTFAAGVDGATSRASRALLASLIVYVFSALMALPFGLLLIPAIAAAAIAAGAVGREATAR